MAKFKLVILVLVAVVLVVFAVENSQPTPVIKLFKHTFGELPTYLVAYISLAVGLVLGWFAHALRLRRKNREVQAAQEAASTQQQESE